MFASSAEYLIKIYMKNIKLLNIAKYCGARGVDEGWKPKIWVSMTLWAVRVNFSECEYHGLNAIFSLFDRSQLLYSSKLSSHFDKKTFGWKK